MSKSIGKLVLRTFGRAQSKPLTKDKGIKEKLGANFNKPLMELSNSRVSFSFDKKTGSLVQIKNLNTGREFLLDKKGNRLFRIIVPTKEWNSRYIDSHESICRMKRKGNELHVFYENLFAAGKLTGISAHVLIILPLDSMEAYFTIELQNHSQDIIEQVKFPWVGGWIGIDGHGKDVITVACSSRDPHKMFPSSDTSVIFKAPYQKYDTFPAPMFLPWMDISGKREGLSYICYMKKSVASGILTEHLRPYDNAGLCLGWSWVNDPFIKPGEKWISSRIGIGIHTSDWHETSDRYRAWLSTWYKPIKVTERLKKSIGFQNILFCSWDGTVFRNFKELPILAKESLKYGVKDICIWDIIHQLYIRDNGDEILEDIPQRREELRIALLETKKLGCNVSMIFNFRLMRRTSKPFSQYGEELAIRRKDGSAYMAIEVGSHYHAGKAESRPAYNLGDTYVLCQTPKKFSERALEIIKLALQLGITSILIDQPTEGTVCLSKTHGHSSPDDTPQGASKWIEEAGLLVRKNNPEGYLIGELPDVFNIQNMELWWYWFWRNNKPEVMRYCLPDSLQTWPVDVDIAEINRAFVLGFYLTIVFHGMEGTLKDNKVIAQHISKLSTLRRTCAEYTVMAKFFDDRGLKNKDKSTIAKVYIGEKSIGIIVGEVLGKESKINLAIDTKILGVSLRVNNCKIYSTDYVEGKLLHVKLKEKIINIKTVLKPFEVQVIELRVFSSNMSEEE